MVGNADRMQKLNVILDRAVSKRCEYSLQLCGGKTFTVVSSIREVFSVRAILNQTSTTKQQQKMGKRKTTSTQSHDQPKRNRPSGKNNTNDTSDEVIGIKKN